MFTEYPYESFIVGIGAESARVVALAGANVWLAGRNMEKTHAVADSIVSECKDPSRIHVIALDLSSLDSVRECGEELLKAGVALHILLNNAGCMAVQKRETTADGFEMQFGANWKQY